MLKHVAAKPINTLLLRLDAGTSPPALHTHALALAHCRVPQVSGLLAVSRTLPSTAPHAVCRVIVVRAVDGVAVALAAFYTSTTDEAELRVGLLSDAPAPA